MRIQAACMNKIGAIVAMIVLVLFGPVVRAETTSISFESTGGSYQRGDSIIENGFKITFGTYLTDANPRNDFYVINGPSMQCYPQCVTNGSNVLYSFNSVSSWTINSLDGRPFSVISFDAASPMLTNYSSGVHLIGTPFQGPYGFFDVFGLSSNFSSAELPVEFSAGEFQSVSFYGGNGYGYNSFAIDNIVLVSPASVPEPATYALILVGLGLLGGISRRRKMLPQQSRT